MSKSRAGAPRRTRHGDIVVRQLSVDLKDADVQLRGEELAETAFELAAIEEDKKAAAEDFKERTERVKKRQTALAHAVRNRSELRPIDCGWEPDYDAGVMNLVRFDNNVVVESRPLYQEERQRHLDLIKQEHRGRVVPPATDDVGTAGGAGANDAGTVGGAGEGTATATGGVAGDTTKH